MTTTSLKLSDELKQRAAAVALNLGMTPHAFMVDAIRKTLEAAEKHAEFVEQAKAARKKMLKTGLGFEAGEVHGYLRERIKAAALPVSSASSTNAEVVAPKAKPWRC
jgi:predicted transcriptional regulator